MKKIAKLLIVTSLLTAGAGAYAWSVRPRTEVRLDVGTAQQETSVDGTTGRSAAHVTATTASHVEPGKGMRTALLIGINNAAGAAPLYGAVQDAQNMYDALRGYGFPAEDITLLTEGQATRARIIGELDDLAKRTSPDGVAVFSFAGHSGRSGGVNSFRTVDGQRVSAPELGAALGRVRAPMWVAMPTCYSGGYNVPGIVGPNRIATFASAANEVSYEVGSRGSYLIHYMVRLGMIEKNASSSVEAAFEWARNTLQQSNPDRVPSMSDGIPGDLDLTVRAPKPGGPEVGPIDTPAPDPTASPDVPEPSDAPEDPSAGGVEVCGLVGCRP